MTSSVLDATHIALIDDHELFLDGLAGLIREMGRDVTVSSYSSPVDFLTALSGGAQFDLVITDLTMRDMNGLMVVSEARAQCPGIPVIVLSAVEEGIVRDDVQASGAARFVHKSLPREDLHRVMLSVLTEAQKEHSATKHVTYSATVRPADLSRRQVEVLSLLATGASNKEISAQLNISENTVKSHLKTIFSALGVTRRTASIQKARALGLI